MKKILTITFIGVLTLAASCAKQDTVYKEYLKEGGYIYPAKAINASVEKGYQRITLKWEAPMDPSLRTAKVFWDNRTQSRDFNYADYPAGKLEATIDNLEDRSYTFEIVNFDEAGNKSLATERTTAPFGESWLVSHAERSVTSAKMDGEDAVILMTKSTDEMTATHFRYKNAAGQWIEGPTMLPADREIRLPGAQKGKYFEYRSSYKPADGMDEVASVSWTKSPEPILYPLDTKGWKVSVTTDQEYSSYTADKIFDGNASSSGRWHSSRSSSDAKKFPKVLTVDTGAEEGKENTFSSFVMNLSPSGSTYHYIREIAVYIGDKPFDPDDADYAQNYGTPVFEGTVNRNDNDPEIAISPAKAGRYFAIVFKNSYHNSGYIDLWELVPYGYIPSEAE